MPIQADVRRLDWSALVEKHGPFHALVVDPPWQLATANPSRGVALGYMQMSDDELARLPLRKMQMPGGLIFLWYINSKLATAVSLLSQWGYDIIGEQEGSRSPC